jgi:hypothetical protein
VVEEGRRDWLAEAAAHHDWTEERPRELAAEASQQVELPAAAAERRAASELPQPAALGALWEPAAEVLQRGEPAVEVLQRRAAEPPAPEAMKVATERPSGPAAEVVQEPALLPARFPAAPAAVAATLSPPVAAAPWDFPP